MLPGSCVESALEVPFLWSFDLGVAAWCTVETACRPECLEAHCLLGWMWQHVPRPTLGSVWSLEISASIVRALSWDPEAFLEAWIGYLWLYAWKEWSRWGIRRICSRWRGLRLNKLLSSSSEGRLFHALPCRCIGKWPQLLAILSCLDRSAAEPSQWGPSCRQLLAFRCLFSYLWSIAWCCGGRTSQCGELSSGRGLLM